MLQGGIIDWGSIFAGWYETVPDSAGPADQPDLKRRRDSGLAVKRERLAIAVCAPVSLRFGKDVILFTSNEIHYISQASPEEGDATQRSLK